MTSETKDKLTQDQKAELRELIIEEIRFHGSRSFQQLVFKANRHFGYEKANMDTPCYRAVDYAIQTLRRQDKIEWFRFGTYKMWKIKDA